MRGKDSYLLGLFQIFEKNNTILYLFCPSILDFSTFAKPIDSLYTTNDEKSATVGRIVKKANRINIIRHRKSCQAHILPQNNGFH